MDLSKYNGFDWDEYNARKNWEKHRVSTQECEKAFFNLPLLIVDDEVHSKHEKRHVVFGQTDEGRQLAIVFTVRGDLIRVISARDMDRKERRGYSS